MLHHQFNFEYFLHKKFLFRKQIHFYERERIIKVEFIFGRNLMGFVMTTALPTILANAIGHSTTFFGDHFDASIGVSLTVLLVITTMYVGFEIENN